MAQKRRAAADLFKEQNVLAEEQMALPAQEAERLEAFASSPGEGRARVRRAPSPKPPPAPQASLINHLKTSEEMQLEKEPIRVRETGFFIWKQVIVPPNAYVVHTRLGREKPVTLGLGVSFRYNPYADAYLIVPAAMQTIGVVANCITQEKQGINILAYVQWQIADFSVAYRKLDFSDPRDPLGIVNAQLREQAEAAIKDKIATMSVEEVLTDKAPIIEELTTRLKEVSEGRSQNEGDLEEGLGIKIVTVQIREALVSSQTLWQDLQAPFRHEQEKMARVSHLQMQDEIRQKELETRQATETREAETMVEIERIKQSKQTEAVEIKLVQETTRFTQEQESAQQKVQLEEQTTAAKRESEQRLHTQAARMEQERKLATLQRVHEETLEQAALQNEASTRQKTLQIENALHILNEESRLAERKVQAEQERLAQEMTLKTQEAEVNLRIQELADAFEAAVLAAQLTRQRDEHTTQLELEEASNQVKIALLEKEAAIARLQQEVRNLIAEPDLLNRFIDQLPKLAAEMPAIQEMRVLQTGNGDAAFDALSIFVAKMLAMAESLGLPLQINQPKATPPQPGGETGNGDTG